MSIATIKASNRYYRVVPSTGDLPGTPFLELGPAGTTQQVSTMMVQFNPDPQFAGDFVVMGRLLGEASNAIDAPFVPIPYRRLSLNDVASDGALVSVPISTSAIICIPANGMSIALMNSLTAGRMDILAWDLLGPSMI